MNKYTIGNLTRITKSEARKLWGKRDMALCPVNLRPGGPWNPECAVDASRIAEELASEYDHERNRADFNRCVRDFEFYNCSCNETGTYTAFYLITPEAPHE